MSRKPTIVVVHGAFADGSGFQPVIEQLVADGYPVLVAPNPLRGLSSDAAQVRALLNSVEGPIVLVGHSYGGAVISATATSEVKALVYLAAFVPETGESVQELVEKFPGSTVGQSLKPVPLADGQVDLYIDPGCSTRTSRPTCRPTRPHCSRSRSDRRPGPPSVSPRRVRRRGTRSRTITSSAALTGSSRQRRRSSWPNGPGPPSRSSKAPRTWCSSPTRPPRRLSSRRRLRRMHKNENASIVGWGAGLGRTSGESSPPPASPSRREGQCQPAYRLPSEEVNMFVLVTGGSGFVGAHCIRQLLSQGHRVRTTVRSPQREEAVRAMLPARVGHLVRGGRPDLRRRLGKAVAGATRFCTLPRRSRAAPRSIRTT